MYFRKYSRQQILARRRGQPSRNLPWWHILRQRIGVKFSLIWWDHSYFIFFQIVFCRGFFLQSNLTVNISQISFLNRLFLVSIYGVRWDFKNGWSLVGCIDFLKRSGDHNLLDTCMSIQAFVSYSKVVRKVVEVLPLKLCFWSPDFL